MIRLPRASHTSPSPALAKWADNLPERFLACRDFGHAWKSFSASYHPEQQQYRRELVCPRCKASKVQWLNVRGHVESTAYSYVDGYQRPPDSGAYTVDIRDSLRLHHLANVIEVSGAA